MRFPRFDQVVVGLAGALILGGAAPVAAQRIGGAQARAIDRVFDRFAGTATPGCAVGVYRGRSIAYARGYGMGNLELGVPIGTASTFQLASVSKQFTAMALVLLEQDGALRLDDDIQRYLPEVPTFGRSVTIRQMINHTSGIRDGLTPLVLGGLQYPGESIRLLDALSAVTRQERLEFEPGTDYSYSNATYWLMGIIVQRVTGHSLTEFTTDRIFKPLGMHRTRFHGDPASLLPGRTHAYSLRGSDSTYRLDIPFYESVGAGGLYSSVDDLVHWHRNFVDGTVGGAAGIRAMETRGVLASGDTLAYALGIARGSYRGAVTWSHSGSDGGYRTYLVRLPEHDLGVAVLCNANHAAPTLLAEQVVDIVLGAALPARADSIVPAGAASTAAELAEHAGYYRNERDLYRFAVHEGALRFGLTPPGRPLRALGGNRYQLGADSLGLFTFRQRDGRWVVERPHPYIAGRIMELAASPAGAPTADQLAAYAGEYWSEDVGAAATVSVKEGRLVIRHHRGDEVPLRPSIADGFVPVGSGSGRYQFQRHGDSWSVVGFVIDTDRAHGIRFVRRR
ncbi:MAG: beta-lactamase family protein [Gemmatimonadales bacterium]|nr:beta-lactamase family protein [Gemmatimonadales bacterium]